MVADARMILAGGHRGGLAEALEGGREDKRRREMFEIAKADRDRAIKIEDEKIAAERTAAQRKAQDEANRKNLESIAVGAVEVAPLLDSIENIPRAVSTLNRRVQEIEARGGDASDTKEVLEMIQSGRVDQARSAVGSAIQAAQAQGILKGQTSKASAKAGAAIPAVGPNGESGVLTTTTLPDGTVQSRFIPAGPGVKFTNRQGETPQDIQRREVETAGGKTQVTEEEKRKQSIINQGQQVADSAPTLKRTIELLDAVATGGVLNQAQLKFAQTFGIETADQGELSANLGKAVLSQLRETFGAQFTEAEGDRLANIEAGFGKNNETNRRLLQNALQIVEAKARRAIKLARANDDEVTAQIIEDALNMQFSQGETQNQSGNTRLRFDAQGNPVGN